MRRDRACLPLWFVLSLLAVGTTGFLLSLLAVGTTGSTPVYSAPPKTGDDAQLVAVQPLREAETVRYYSGMTSKQRLVIRDATTWASTWKEMTSIFGDLTRSSTPTVPAVDFTKNDRCNVSSL